MTRPGVNLLPDLSHRTIRRIADDALAVKRPGDIIVASIHWGDNWGYGIPHRQRVFAHQLIDRAGVDIVHGHSSHHPKGIEVYQKKPILYGCGDFMNDYEGISGYEEYRDDLAQMYFLELRPTDGALASFTMVPLQIRKFRLRRASRPDAQWLHDVLNREGAALGTQVEIAEDNTLTLRWR